MNTTPRDDNGPSDEEASTSQSSFKYYYHHQSRSSKKYYDDYDIPPTLSPPPLPKSIYPSSPPSPPPPPDPRRKSRSSSRYPTTIQVNAPRSRKDIIRPQVQDEISDSDDSEGYESDDVGGTGEINNSNMEGGAADNFNRDDEEENYDEYDDEECYEEEEYYAPEAAAEKHRTDGKYESFNAPSANNSFLDNSMDESYQKSSSNHHNNYWDLPIQPKKASQVLVHYHPQLGDTGYESTLIEQTAAPSEHSYARVSRAMNVATTRREMDRPPKHIYPTSRGMHSRMIDDARVEEEMNHSPKKSRVPFIGSSSYEEGNDEYNNAATRQIRRRVFRVAMERGIRYERRKKLLDADADVGGPSQRVIIESNIYTNGNGNGYQRSTPTPVYSTAQHAEDGGDMPLTPGKLTTPKTISDDHSAGHITSSESLRSYVSQAPPSPPSYPPSYKTLVYNLISANEPDKLVQIDRVMEKYAGREEELIKKLDLRYRRQRIKRNIKSEADVMVSGGKMKQSDEEGTSKKPQLPMLNSQSSRDEGVAPMIIETVVMSPPKKLTFVKVDPPPNKTRNESENAAQQSRGSESIGSGDGFDTAENKNEITQDEIMIQPKISQRTLSRAMSESTKTQVHTNASGELDDDENSGMIPITPKMMNNVLDLGNQVVNERLQREREELLKNKMKSGEAQVAPVVPETASKLDIIGGDSSSIPEPYKLTKQLSYGDGISVITMETKSTLQNRMAPYPVGEREARFSFDDMKRPPSSITVESAGSGSKGEENNAVKPQLTKLQRVIPEIETDHEKAVVAMAALEASSILDNVEARILARQKLREEENEVSEKISEETIEVNADDEDLQDAATKTNEEKIEDCFETELGAPIKAEEELNEIESLFQEARGVSLSKDTPLLQDGGIEKEQVLECNDMEVVVDDEEKEAAISVDQPIIESIISSFDDDDDGQNFDKRTSPQDHRKMEMRDSEYQSTVAIDKNEARQPDPHSTETSSTQGGGGESIVSVLSIYSIAQKAIAEAARAELQRQKELAEYTERRQKNATNDASSAFTNDNLEEEIARLIAEKESRFQAERAVALMRAQRELEAERKARLEAEAARLMVEKELERLKSKEIPVADEAPSDQQGKSFPFQGPAENVPAETLDSGERQDVLSPSDHFSKQDYVDKYPENLLQEDSCHTGDETQEIESIISDAEAVKVSVVDEVEKLGTVSVILGHEVVGDQKCILAQQTLLKQSHQEMVERTRIEAEASRRRAEKELERLRGERISMEVDEKAQLSAVVQFDAENEPDFLRANSKLSEDDVEIFRHGYSTDDESLPKQIETVHEKECEEIDALEVDPISDGMKSVEPQMSSDLLGPDVLLTASHNLKSEVGQKALSQGSAAGGKDENEIFPCTAQHAIVPVHQTLEITQTDELRDKVVFGNDVLQESHPYSQDSNHTSDESHGNKEAIIHHVARVTFEGNPSKGQLSFTTGSKVEAHSNQRGPWWLGRCGGRTGWFPASAIVPESEFLAKVIGPLSGNDEPDAFESEEPLSGDDLNAVYDLIRNPSDPLSQDGNESYSDDESGSPAKSRWLDTENSKSCTPASPSRDHSPPPTRLDPSEMAGLSERLYEPHINDFHSNKGGEQSPSDVPTKNADGEIGLPSGDIGETRSTEELSCVELADVSKNDTSDVVQPESEISTKSDTCTTDVPKLGSKTPKHKPEWRAAKDPKSGFIYYYHTGTRETTWEKPEGFVPKKVASPKRQESTVSSKDKYNSRRKGILGFISKITKGANLSSEKSSVKKASTEVDSREKEKFNAEHQTETTEISELKPSAMTEVLRNGVLSDDDNISASDDESEVSRMSEITDTTLFSKQKLKAAVGKWAEKVSDKLNSPADPAYESLNDDAAQPQDCTEVEGDVAEGNHSDSSKELVSEEKPQWRSAIDEATGRTYYYIRGTSKTKVTWEKPEALCEQ